MRLIRRWKIKFWKHFTPHFPRLRDMLIKYKLLHHKGRQRYPIGQLNANKNAHSLRAHLENIGFEPCPIAWVDEGEVLGMRKIDLEIFHYHLRLSGDGELRGHYEHMAEHYAIRHFLEWGMEARGEEFKNMLGDWLD